MKKLFWLRNSILENLVGSWKLGRRHGVIDLRPIRLTTKWQISCPMKTSRFTTLCLQMMICKWIPLENLIIYQLTNFTCSKRL